MLLDACVCFDGRNRGCDVLLIDIGASDVEESVSSDSKKDDFSFELNDDDLVFLDEAVEGTRFESIEI